jgi:hypothetical protein
VLRSHQEFPNGLPAKKEEEMPKTFNGIGTKYLGASDRQSNGSFVTTEWFVIFDFPVIPLRSQRVQYLNARSNVTRTTELYNIVVQLPLNAKQVLKTYATLGGTLAAGILLLLIGLSSERAEGLCIGYLLFFIVFWIWIAPGIFFKAK